ncbi:MAG: hypothetical protein MUP14_07635 [Dehalococcoidia bacterium]|nr:hypothetical protein [Dehalococcoidia bacterium]
MPHPGSRRRSLILMSCLFALALVLAAGGETGASPQGTTELVSVDSAGNQGDSSSYYPATSADGRYVAFQSNASNLVPGDTNNRYDIFVHDRQTGTTDRVSVDSAGNQANGSSREAAISGDGRYVAFDSSAPLVPGDGLARDVFVHDRQTGTTEEASVPSAGDEANGASWDASVTPDGRYVAFCSNASDLVPGDSNSVDDVFVYDRQTGITERVSLDSGGNEGNRNSCGGPEGRCQDLSADGRYVVFRSSASNLVPGDTNNVSDIFVHDRQTGTTERVSVDSAGNEGNAHSWAAAISADGRYVAFHSYASNLVPGDTNDFADVFVHDRQAGATELVSVDSAGNQGNSVSANPVISADGRYVAFASQASNLVAGDTNDDIDVFVHDRQTGATTRVSVDSAGNEGNWWSQHAAISSDGRYVAFSSQASNLVPEGTNGYEHIFVHDRDADGDGIFDEAGAIATRVLTGEGNAHSTDPAMSPDGRYVVFQSWASNLVAEDTNGVVDIFVHDRDTDGDGIFDEAGATATERVSVDSAGNQGNEESQWPAISADGRYVTFAAWASNLVPGDTNGNHDVFWHDRQTGATERVSVSSAGNEGNATSEFPAISADGRYVAFQSQASNLVPGDAGDDYDVFVHDCQTGATERVSVNYAGYEGNDWSRYPALSADGRYVAFESSAGNLVMDDTNGSDDIFVHDRLGIPPTPAPTPTSTVTPTRTIAPQPPTPQPPAPETPTPEVPPTAAPPPTVTPSPATPEATPTPAATSIPQPTPTPNATPVVTPTPVRAPAMLPATGGGGLLDDNGLPRAAVLAAVVALAPLTSGAWYARRRWLA